MLMRVLNILSGPAIGAVIGYFTNYLAVKMLFRPYKPKKIGSKVLPFTPGIIPKRQPQLAKAIGKAVGEELFTGEDIKRSLLSDQQKESIVNGITESLRHAGTLKAMAENMAGENGWENAKTKISEFAAGQLLPAIERMNVGRIVAEQGAAVINEKKSSLGMLGMFLSDDLINGLLGQVAEAINQYIAEHGHEIAIPAIREQVDQLAQQDLHTLIGEDQLNSIVSLLYDKFVSSALDGLLSGLDIASVVESKVNAMDMRELENLCMSVMKKELNAIVNLGAVLGFLIGIVNVFI